MILLVGCSPTGGHGSTTTTTGGSTTTTEVSTTTTTSPTTGHVAGLTENQVCPGLISPAGCTTPFDPASDQVTISTGSVVFRKLQSASNGVFTADLPPGLYNFDADTSFAGAGVACPLVSVTVTAGATVPATLHCTIQLP